MIAQRIVLVVRCIERVLLSLAARRPLPGLSAGDALTDSPLAGPGDRATEPITCCFPVFPAVWPSSPALSCPPPMSPSQVILGNPGMAFSTDPNGFVVPAGKRLAGTAGAAADAAAARKRAAEAAALSSSMSSMFDHLVGTVLSGSASANGSGHAGSVSATPASGTPENVQWAAAKAAFLQRYGDEYGYNGRIDELYPREVSLPAPGMALTPEGRGAALVALAMEMVGAKERRKQWLQVSSLHSTGVLHSGQDAVQCRLRLRSSRQHCTAG